jgi:outer membrane protein TolC
MKRAVIIAAVLLALGAWADPTPPIMPKVVETPLPPPVTLPAPAETVVNAPLTADEAARIALRRQPSLVVVQQSVAAGEGRVAQAQAGLRPSLTLSSSYANQVLVDGASKAATGFSSGATLKQLLFDFNHTRDVVRQADAQVRAARANLSRAESDLVFQTKGAFYTYAQALRLVSVQEANVRNRQEHLAQAQARVKAGVGLPIDVVRAETAVAGAILSLNQARTAAALAQTTLALTMGIDPRTPLTLAEGEEPATATADVNALVRTALGRRPEITQAQAALQATQYAVNAARSTSLPTLNGTVGFGMSGDRWWSDDHNVGVGASVQWPLGDGGLTAGKVAEAKANQTAAQAQLTAAVLAVTNDVSQAYLNAKMAEQRLATADAEVTNAGEAVRLAQGRYNAGLGTFLDVLDAQAALTTAQTNRVNAQTAINQSRAALAHAVNGDPVVK